MSTVVVLHGPRARACADTLPGRDDIVIDHGRIIAALVSPSATTRPDHVQHVAYAAYRSTLDRAVRLREDVTVWFVHPDATAEQLRGYRARGFTLRPPL